MKSFFLLFFYKRIILFNLLLPLAIGFLMMSFLGKNISHQMNNYDTTFSLGLVNLDGDNELYRQIKKRKDIVFMDSLSKSEAISKATDGSLNLALIIPKDFSENILNNQQSELLLYHKNNQSQIDDLVSSISSFEEKIIIERMDSMGLSKSYINPISIDDTDTSNFIKSINDSISSYTPLLFFIIGFWGLIFPTVILFSKGKEKRNIRQNPLWDKIFSISLFGAIIALIFLIGMWFSISFTEGHPAFLKGFFKQYFSALNILHLFWVLLLSHLFWAGLLSTLSHKSEKAIGAFGISYFSFTIFILSLVVFTGAFSTIENATFSFISFIPILNSIATIKYLFLGNGISFIFILLSIIGLLLWGSIGFFIANKFIKE